MRGYSQRFEGVSFFSATCPNLWHVTKMVNNKQYTQYVSYFIEIKRSEFGIIICLLVPLQKIKQYE